ncbi:hypothetical protein CDL12_03550 [Handroanthus impetiginosus]|uniref:Uncharacterized protein n=1 Tax=Handroanthus impetiginosus TaxID=429701 RepID=A0A2G9I1U7_9LAMI|nr:hypothetical protein CDL12_03550 [Handroanthus impetiginosus]
MSEARAKLKQLQQRHTVFGFIVNHPNVSYDIETNYVHANDYIWDYCTMKYPLAEAYMLCGESYWEEMCIIFGNPSLVNVNPRQPNVDIFGGNLPPLRDGSHPSRSRLSSARGKSSKSHMPSFSPMGREISPAYWDNLGKLVSLSDLPSEKSVHNKPSRIPSDSGEAASSYGSSSAPT